MLIWHYILDDLDLYLSLVILPSLISTLMSLNLMVELEKKVKNMFLVYDLV